LDVMGPALTNVNSLKKTESNYGKLYTLDCGFNWYSTVATY